MSYRLGDPQLTTLEELCHLYLRSWDRLVDDGSGGVAPTFDPPLTVEEQATYARLVRAVRSAVPGITPDEWLAIEDDLAALRTFRQQTQAQFMALTATQRDRALFDVVNAQTNVLRALVRD